MPRFRVSDLMINVGEAVGGGGGGGCHLITECGGVTELCVEATQGCAFTENCRCTIHTACGDEFTCQCSICTPCTGRTCGCTCTGPSFCTACTNCTQTCACSFGHSVCTLSSACGVSIRCTPTFTQGAGQLQPEHLSQLKDQLRGALERLEAEEQRQRESMQPQTLEDVNQVEEKLNAALEEVRRRRAELEGQEQGKNE